MRSPNIAENHEPHYNSHKSIKAVYVLIFFLMIALPGIQTIFRFFPEPASTEYRTLSNLPEFKWNALSEYPKKFEKYFNDHFGFRNLLIRYHALFKVKLSPLPVSPSKKVIAGQNGWYFYNSDEIGDGFLTKDWRGLIQYTDRELETIKSRIDQYYSYFEKQGIPFLIVIAPNKSTIYPEFMPKDITRVNPRTRMDQVIEYLETHSKYQILDVRPALSEAKKTYLTHYKTGTHWNNFGGFIAYQEIMKKFAESNPEFKPFDLSDFEIEIIPEKGRGLARMMGLGDQMRDEQISFKLKSSAPKPKLFSRLILYSDSYFEFFLPFFLQHFDRVRRVKSGTIPIPAKYEQKPDAVILEVAERYQGVFLTGQSFT